MFAQIEVSKTDVLDLGNNIIQPVFSADGKQLIFNSLEGGKTYNLETKDLNVFSKAAYDYSMDLDGKIRYRMDTFVDGMRMNSVKVYDSKNNSTTTIIDKQRLDVIPTVTEHGTYYMQDDILKTDNTLAKASSKPIVISYDHSLLVYSYGTTNTIKPAGEDKFYLWPSVSPNNEMIAFVDINDLYVTSIDGDILFTVKEARAPKWSPDGKWITFMRDSDDGHVFLSSDIYVVRVEDAAVFNLTQSEEKIEMYPSWSPDGSQIVCEEISNDNILLLTLDIK